MKQMLKLSIVALFSACAFVSTTSARIMIRSQGVDAARELSGWTNHINLFDMGGIYGSFAITPEYAQSFKSEKIARSLFGDALLSNCDSDCAQFLVQGSRVSDRNSKALLADYFGLATDFESTVTVKPKIQQFILDFNLYLGLDEWLCGLWARFEMPVVWARWKLGYCENVTENANGYDAGYFTPSAVSNSDLNQSFGAYLNGGVPTLNNGVSFTSLNNSTLPCFSANNNNSCSTGCGSCESNGGIDKTRVAQFQMALGWNFWQDEDYHLGLGLVARAPTGTEINSRTIFSPIIGNGHHWELGGLITSHYTFWRSCDYDQSFGFYMDAWITHLFKTTQCRTFDLCGRGDNSKYMLAQLLKTPAGNNLEGSTENTTANPTNPTASTYQFDNVFVPVANLTQQQLKVSIPVQADVVAMFNYTNCGFAWDFGYNFWGVSCEKFSTCKNPVIPANTYALKGDAHVFGFDAAGSPTANRPVALGATQSQATIYTGLNFDGTNSVSEAIVNPNIDNAQFAYGDGISTVAERALYATSTIAPSNHINTSIQSVFLSDADINYCGEASKGLTNAVFTHFSYTWEDHDCWIPYLGIGGKVEFASNGKCNDSCDTGCATACSTVNSCSTSCNSSIDCGNDGCKKTAISQWMIWLKGGVSFN